jgi:hypothetical protein
MNLSSRVVAALFLYATFAASAAAQVRLSVLSVDSAGGPSNRGSKLSSLSADGRFVAFDSYASDLVPGDVGGYDDVFVFDRLLGTRELVSRSSSGIQGNAGSWSPDSRPTGVTWRSSRMPPTSRPCMQCPPTWS